MPILIIGSTDISQYINEGNLQCSRSPVYADKAFTAATGAQHRTLVGDKYSISCQLTELTDSEAAAVAAACVDNVSVTFACPVMTTATFGKPSVSSQLITVGSDGVGKWDMDISMACECMPCGL